MGERLIGYTGTQAGSRADPFLGKGNIRFTMSVADWDLW